MKNSIKAVVFDLGGVILKIHWQRTFQVWNLPLPKGNPALTSSLVPSIDRGPNRPSLYLPHYAPFLNYERGTITGKEFYQSLVQDFGLQVDYPTFLLGWNACLGQILFGIEPIITQLAKQTPIFALSNTNREHESVFRPLSIFGHFDHLFLSHDMGARKPEEAIFKQVEEKLNLLPEQILFIDDLTPNLESAKTRGWCIGQSLDSPEQTKAVLEKHGFIF